MDNPEFNFPWNVDQDGEYLRIRTNEGAYDIRQDNTDIYTHDLCPDADHIFYTLYENEDEVPMGFRLFRQKFDQIMGDGAFDVLIEDMRCRNFFEITTDVPTEEDEHYYVKDFGYKPRVADKIETIIYREMKNFEKEVEYYLGHEWN